MIFIIFLYIYYLKVNEMSSIKIVKYDNKTFNQNETIFKEGTDEKLF